ncbi:Pyridoxal/pyridoxine/pyridoxamine kinase [Phaffia rhodozyma]|uniref:pyridoxal kinase n=1 Tax=Phaffia rhodozyma TaxID=264483 RepID=A0A0F7SKX5_PHARH|nr:Pyridoxal/pyridoxine/pyridoxamine kinase [Phaffia rhodozyma]
MSVPPLSVNSDDLVTVSTGKVEAKRVLSVQSHVCSGYVGNKAATFPLQLLGWNVDVVNTVQFSNHTGYGHTAGTRTTAADLKSIFGGLKSNGLLKAGRLLTGYIPGGEAVQVVGKLAQLIIQERDASSKDRLIYVLDPVMGDHGTLYVAESVIPIYRSLLHLATIVTPNQFEAETLASQQITTPQSLQELLQSLHKTYRIPHIIISSFTLATPFPASLLPGPPVRYIQKLSSLPIKEEQLWESYPLLYSVASTWDVEREELVETVVFQFPQIKGYFSGVGDLFSALTLAHYNPDTDATVARAASKALFSTQQVLLSTHLSLAENREEEENEGSDEEKDGEDRSRRVKRMRRRELRVVDLESRGDLTDGEGWNGQKVDLSSL